jgi:hypothetical protein
MRDLSSAEKVEYLRAHVEERNGVRVASLHRLDRGVFSCDVQDGQRWIVRGFAAERSLEQVKGDADILRHLETQGFPAELTGALAIISVRLSPGSPGVAKWSMRPRLLVPALPMKGITVA